jgi:hypothetical protein
MHLFSPTRRRAQKRYTAATTKPGRCRKPSLGVVMAASDFFTTDGAAGQR